MVAIVRMVGRSSSAPSWTATTPYSPLALNSARVKATLVGLRLTALSKAGVGKVKDLVIYSDRNESILTAVNEVFPDAEWVPCAVHLNRNLQLKWTVSHGDLSRTNHDNVVDFNEFVQYYWKACISETEEEKNGDLRTRSRRREDRREVRLFQVPGAVSRDVHVRLEVQSHDDAVLQSDRELHVSTAPQLQREGRSERGDLLQPLSLPRPVDVPVQGEDKTLDIHRETVCPRGAAKGGGDHVSVGSEGSDSLSQEWNRIGRIVR